MEWHVRIFEDKTGDESFETAEKIFSGYFDVLPSIGDLVNLENKKGYIKTREIIKKMVHYNEYGYGSISLLVKKVRRQLT